MNWQYSAAFAEDGKKKEVISYFDGALRGRQTVSINNADNVPVVQENIYDEFGRAAASILPSPYKDPAVTETPSLHYVTNFNLSTTSTASVPVPYSIADIGGTSLPTDCEALPGQLKNTSGTSLYYSANNPFKALNKYNNYIPDAGGYPLAVTQYTKDNTGRVKLQGGVGLTFQPGNVSGGTSHTTKYYYGKPEQWELDEMFGNDAGYAEHYQKNMAIDPNGQASVNYINASGKTVATALTGPVPANLDALAKTGDQNQVTTALLNPSQFSYSSTELKLSATTSYLAPVADNNASLQYNIQELINHYPTTGSFSVCSNCYYDLKVSITDDCGNIIYPAGAAALPSIGSATSLCTFSDPTPTKSITGINFPRPGEYKVTFEFSMSNQVIDNYVDNFVAQSLTSGYLLTQYNYLKQNYLSTVDMSGCFNDCKTCKVMLGGEPDFKQMLTDEFAAQGVDISQVTTDFNSWAHTVYTTLSNKCTSLVSTCDYAPCNTAQQNMLADVSPGGQYALFDNSGNALEPDINVIANNFSTVFANNHPPQTLDPSDVIALDDPTTPQLSVYDPRFNLLMMLKYWNPVWAQKFLPFHPEYCKLRFCQDNQLYENWDEALKYQSNSIAGIANIPGAPATPTYDGTNPLLLLTLDPFFKSTGPGASYYTSMSNDLQSYSTLKLGLTDLAVKSLPQYITYMLNCASTDNTQWGNCSPAASCRAYEKEWLMYRDLYLQCKQKYYELLRNTAPYCGTSTCPIGQPYVAQDPAASMQPADFIIQPYRNDPAGTCDANSQEYSIQYAGGRIPQSVIVNLNNPSINLSFPQGSTLVTFCAPLSTPATAITIRSITSTTNNLSTTDKYLDISEAVTTRIPFTIRAYTGWFFGSHWENFACEQDSTTTTIALRDYQGNLTTSASPITVILTYIKSSAPPSSLSYLQLPFTIPAGKSTLKVTYVSYDNFKTNDSGDPIGVTAMQLSGLSNGGGALPYPGTKTYNFGSNPSSGSCSTAYANKDSRFPSAATNGYQAKELNPSSQITGISDANTALIKGQNNYDLIAGNLITALTPGLTAMSATTTQINNLKMQLIEVCTIGTDPAHPFGVSVLSPPPQGQSASTSTVPPSLTASGNTSFGDAIKHTLGITYFTATLNPWLVNSPYPYNAQPIQTAKVIGNSSPQIKAEIDQLKAAYTTATGQAYTLTGFYNYLVATYGTAMSLTSAQLDALITAGTSCNYLLKTDVPLPVFLDPSAAGCILKGDYLAAKTALQAAFNNALSTSHANYQTIYANYMNQRWGFTFSYSDYMAFEAAYTANAATPLCSKPPFIAVDPDNYACAREILESTLGSGVRAYNTYIDDAKKAFRAAYISTCSAAQANISMKVKMPVYQYTLYYYDQADNLVRTVPPEGVRLITDPALLQMVTKARSGGDPASCTGASTIPAGNSSVATAFGAMETAFDGGLGGTVELWLYNASAGSGQVVQTTPQGKYRFQITLSSSTLTAEIYSSPSFGDFTQKNRVTVNLAGLPPLQAWTHIALISTNFVTSKPQVMVNGVMAPQALTTPDPVLYTPTLTSLKYMRLYPGRKLPAAE
ncbi:MAG: hypothetical protein JWQ57_3813, partial [Mucilaginibacter sp.]|nr:hypothetical protein [Mucilaginibacter sp.]